MAKDLQRLNEAIQDNTVLVKANGIIMIRRKSRALLQAISSALAEEQPDDPMFPEFRCYKTTERCKAILNREES